MAGSRRLEAARRLGLPAAPVVVRHYTDAEAEAVALLENVQRARLRFDDEARGLLGFKRRHGLTNAQIGRRLGKSADYVELRIAAAEHPAVLDLYLQGRLDQTEIRAAARELRETGALAGFEAAAPAPAPPPMAAGDPKASDTPAPARPSRRPPDGWRWAGDVERRLQQLPARAPRMDARGAGAGARVPAAPAGSGRHRPHPPGALIGAARGRGRPGRRSPETAAAIAAGACLATGAEGAGRGARVYV